MNLNREQSQRISHLIAGGEVAQAAKEFQDATGCDSETARHAVDSWSAAENGVGSTEPAVVQENRQSQGKLWTLISALTVFAFILFSVYTYLIPRLYGERIGRRCQLEVRLASFSADPNFSRFSLPDGTSCFASAKSVLKSDDFDLFRGDSLAQPPTLKLFLSKTGKDHYGAAIKPSSSQLFCFFLEGKPLAVINSAEWTTNHVTISLNGLLYPEANEMFARLTD